MSARQSAAILSEPFGNSVVSPAEGVAATSTRKQRDEDGMNAQNLIRGASFTLLLSLTACATQYARVASDAKSGIVGLTSDDILMCAGHPTTIDKSAGSEIWMYEHGAVTPGGVVPTVVSPYGGASLTQSAGQYCRVQLRFNRGQVTAVSYAGDTDVWGARDAECAPIVRNCLEYRRQR